MELNGTTYHDKTPLAAAQALESARLSGDRVRVWYGDSNGIWPEDCDVTGYIGRSCGPRKVPLIIHNRRSSGGPALLDHRVIRIDRIRDRWTLYGPRRFDSEQWELVFRPNRETHQYAVKYRGDEHAAFNSRAKAERWLAFQLGQRYAY